MSRLVNCLNCGRTFIDGRGFNPEGVISKFVCSFGDDFFSRLSPLLRMRITEYCCERCYFEHSGSDVQNKKSNKSSGGIFGVLVFVSVMSFIFFYDKIDDFQNKSSSKNNSNVTNNVDSNIRSGPSLDSKVLIVIKKNSKFKYIGKKGNWINIEIKNDGVTTLGWIHKNLVTEKF